MRVFVLLYNARTENEGIHTIKIGDRNTVLMFVSSDDAERYALMLEAQDFPVPTVEEIDAEEIEDFCQSADYDAELIEDGMLAVPPEANLEAQDWDKETTQPPTSEPESSLADLELEKIRRRLEGLL
ncbi:DUF3110 domain-containing protein [Merismopedia glauca]|uniref:DUF3110 domain-containing protein n=1 Tax=Merismopedia glauca CCAP 1448/3 TaxID=1296344 RepID=A0A2T1C820_9CYAN|nr:DUF3110 domain-containing protein [Merismopedia glauca]PSB04303.1 DUF3110 domain-containing protein [Merismopedia glauca CCAP 1448/3]